MNPRLLEKPTRKLMLLVRRHKKLSKLWVDLSVQLLSLRNTASPCHSNVRHLWSIPGWKVNGSLGIVCWGVCQVETACSRMQGCQTRGELDGYSLLLIVFKNDIIQWINSPFQLAKPPLHPMFQAYGVSSPTAYVLEVIKKIKSR